MTKRIALAALVAAAAAGPAWAGGIGGTWTCIDAREAPALAFEVKRGGGYGHTYLATPIDGPAGEALASLAGSGDLDYGIAPDGGTSYVAVTGPLKDGGWWATHREVTLYLHEGDADRHSLACRR